MKQQRKLSPRLKRTLLLMVVFYVVVLMLPFGEIFARLGLAPKNEYALVTTVENSYGKLHGTVKLRTAMNQLGRIMQAKVLLYKNFSYTPSQLIGLHSGQKVRLQLKQNRIDGVDYRRPQDLPAQELKYLDLVGQRDFVFQHVQHLFFITDPRVKSHIFPENIGITVDHQCGCVFFDAPFAVYHTGLFSAILVHEAYHIANDGLRNASRYFELEFKPYQLEIRVLTQMLHANQISTSKKRLIQRRIDILEKKKESFAAFL